MSNFKPARPRKVAKSVKRLPPVTQHVFVASGAVTATVHPEAICETCGNPRSHRTHDQRESAEIYTPIDARKIGESE